MISTKGLFDITSVPITWVFEHYCKLTEKLSGQDVRMKSLFNSNDKTPSMFIYVNKEKGVYKYKDFSTNRGGDHVDLVQQLFGLPDRFSAIDRIVKDYSLYKPGDAYTIQTFKQSPRYKVDTCTLRNWNTNDAKYWGQYNIGSKLLDFYNVKPIQEYVMFKEDDGLYKSINVSSSILYGYFNKEEELCKIYQPTNSRKKFLKIKDYVQGSDQLQGKDKLFIASSMKDGLCLRTMFPDFDFIAPDSENSMIKKEFISQLNHKEMYIIFDNDDAGRISTEKYCNMYPNLKPLYLQVEKDVADAVKAHGTKKIQNIINHLL